MRLQPASYLPRAERFAAGRAIRHAAPRRANAEWNPPKDRVDPLGILIRQGANRIPQLLPVRYARMMPSPLTYLRGAAAVMAADLARTATSGLFVQSCGDCHIGNFGAYASPEGTPVFDINDFDETAPAPFEWDLKRLSTSIILAASENGHTGRQAVAMAENMVTSYVSEVARLAGLSPLRAWNARINLIEVIGAVEDRRVREKLQRQLDARLAGFSNQFGMVEPGPVPKFRDRPPLTERLSERDVAVRGAFADYLSALPPERRILLEHYRLTDIVFKVVGVGSVGTFCAIGLFSSPDSEPVLLQIKEAQRSVLEEHLGGAGFANHGERVVVGQRIMQAASDAFLGWTAGAASTVPGDDGAGRDFYVRQMKDGRLAAIGEQLGADLLPYYATLCGRTLARAHARSADLPTLAGYLGRGRPFAEAIAAFGQSYAEQTRHDWKRFTQAIADGLIHAA